jgi:hypothetical protein
VEHRQHAGDDVVTSKRERLRPRLAVEPGVLRHIAGEEAVPGALEALGTQGPVEPPRRPPRPLESPGRQPQQRCGRRRANHGPRRSLP